MKSITPPGGGGNIVKLTLVGVLKHYTENGTVNVVVPLADKDGELRPLLLMFQEQPAFFALGGPVNPMHAFQALCVETIIEEIEWALGIDVEAHPTKNRRECWEAAWMLGPRVIDARFIGGAFQSFSFDVGGERRTYKLENALDKFEAKKTSMAREVASKHEAAIKERLDS